MLSVVVPAFNEASVLPLFHARLLASIDTQVANYEVIYVDDGSTDGTADWLRQTAAEDSRVAFLRLSRNFGKEVALTAGLKAAGGDAVVVIDADLQDPPELIPSMIEHWQRGVDVVNMRRESRSGETWFKKFTAHSFYRILNRLSDVPIPTDVGDFRLLSRRALAAVNQMPERSRYMKGLFAWVGFSQVTLAYRRVGRASGRPKQAYGKLFGLAIEGLTSFSVAPLRLASVLGLAIAGVAFLLTAFYLVKALIFGDSVQGFPTVIVAVLGLGGLQLMGIGVLGEYMGRTFLEVKGRPLYFVDEYHPSASNLAPASPDLHASAPR